MRQSWAQSTTYAVAVAGRLELPVGTEAVDASDAAEATPASRARTSASWRASQSSRSAHCFGVTHTSRPHGVIADPGETLTRGPAASTSTATSSPDWVPKPTASRASHSSWARR